MGNIALTLSTYHISQTDQNLSTHLHQPDYTNPFQIKKTPSEKQYSPYPIYLSHQPDRSEPINTSSSARLYQSIPDKKKLLLKSNIALTQSTYHISQTGQNLSTHLHQPDYTNPFQIKKTPSEKQFSPYPHNTLTRASQQPHNISQHLT